jgi:hypothetical protein
MFQADISGNTDVAANRTMRERANRFIVRT